MSARVAFIKLGRLFTVDSLSPGNTYYHRELQLQRDFRSNQYNDDPVLVDHDEDQQVGDVHELFEYRDKDGAWLAARATITSPPAWLQRGTPASWNYKPFNWQSLNGVERILSGIVTEVSILSPGSRPAEPNAQVMSLRRADLHGGDLLEAWLEERAHYRQLVGLGKHKGVPSPLSWPRFAGVSSPPSSSEHTPAAIEALDRPGLRGDALELHRQPSSRQEASGPVRIIRRATGEVLGVR